MLGHDRDVADARDLPSHPPAHPTTAHRWWVIRYADRDPVEVACYPEATHAEIMERHPDAIAAEPFTPPTRRPASPLSAEDEAAIRAWLAAIDETDPESVANVIERCRQDQDARDYYVGRAAEAQHGVTWRNLA